jgi:hypothetical protein
VLLADGDLEGAALWRTILAIEELRRSCEKDKEVAEGMRFELTIGL